MFMCAVVDRVEANFNRSFFFTANPMKTIVFAYCARVNAVNTATVQALLFLEVVIESCRANLIFFNTDFY